MKNIIKHLIISVFLYACGNINNTKSENDESISENYISLSNLQVKNAGIETSKIKNINIASTIKVNGKIDVPPQNIVSISVPLGGYLKSTKLLPGMHINKGDVLAVMEDIQYIQLQQDYLTAKAQMEMAEKEFNRISELNKSKASSDKNFEQAKAEFQTQMILVKSLEEKLLLIGIIPLKLNVQNISKSINIYSPISGFVAEVRVNIGKYISPSDVMFELVNLEDIHLNLSVFEKDINQLFIGQKLVAYTNTNPNKKYACEIILISKNLSPQNSAEVHCHFEHYDKTLLPGMFMNAEIELKSNQSSVLPEEAIVRFENKQYIFVVKNSKEYQMHQVQTGYTENGLTEIVDTNKLSNKSIVVKGAYNLLMSLKNKNED